MTKSQDPRKKRKKQGKIFQSHFVFEVKSELFSEAQRRIFNSSISSLRGKISFFYSFIEFFKCYGSA